MKHFVSAALLVAVIISLGVPAFAESTFETMLNRCSARTQIPYQSASASVESTTVAICETSAQYFAKLSHKPGDFNREPTVFSWTLCLGIEGMNENMLGAKADAQESEAMALKLFRLIISKSEDADLIAQSRKRIALIQLDQSVQ